MAFDRFRDIDKIPRFNQTQKATVEQLIDLLDVATRLGLYDAADFLKRNLDDGK